MKKLFFLSAVVCFCVSCGGTTGYKVTGQIAGAGDGLAVLSIYNDRREGPLSSDTVEMTNGRFSFTGQVPEVLNCTLFVIPEGNNGAAASFYIENSDITLSADWDNVIENYGYPYIDGVEVEGSRNSRFSKSMSELTEEVKSRPEHRQYAELSKRYMEVNQPGGDIDEAKRIKEEIDPFSGKFTEDLREEQLKLVKANPDLPAAVAYLTWFKNDMSLDELEGLFNSFDEQVRNSSLASEIKSTIEVKKSVLPGKPAPDFTLNQPDGTPLTLSDLRSKVVIIDFWASWCGPCRASNPSMIKFYEKYKDRGVEILGVSNDTNHDKWKEAISQDQLPWLNVVDEFPKPMGGGRVIGMYAAPYLPTLILIDREGTIVAHTIEKDDLEAEVLKLL